MAGKQFEGISEFRDSDLVRTKVKSLCAAEICDQVPTDASSRVSLSGLIATSLTCSILQLAVTISQGWSGCDDISQGWSAQLCIPKSHFSKCMCGVQFLCPLNPKTPPLQLD